MGTPNWPEKLSTTRKKVIKELVDGQDYATQLKSLLHRPTEDHESLSAEELVSKILRSFSETLSVLSSCEQGEVSQSQAVSHADSHCDVRRSEDSGESRKRLAAKDRRGCYKRSRKTSHTWAIVSHTTDDDHAWRKYGQKEILNAKYPRSYFRCTRKYDQGCGATKQVQRMEDDPQMFQTTYIGHHTCRDILKAPQIITDSDPWETFLVNSDTMMMNIPAGKQDRALSSSTTTIKQESLESPSDLTDSISSFGTNLWSELKAFEFLEPAIMSPKMGSDNGDVGSTMYSCTETCSLSLDMDFEGGFDFDGSEFL
ncbi:probable WRKY transcription factor 70 isoform X1 [Juglans microcarpa x Juglans regia]|uniref:probable WRKY transcription factor 70 isoform X1 n=1 Tax=Juglans microcarpa x Juglans regia TaxID=2249226 RepID=UPI001B7F50E6|nr:probable WRKY transcription factor 70 isoform X1 [Juglans microcarpa x Juglans regia]